MRWASIGLHREVRVFLDEVLFVAWMVATAIEVDEETETPDHGDHHVRREQEKWNEERDRCRKDRAKDTFADD